jgi:hypothetical protein
MAIINHEVQYSIKAINGLSPVLLLLGRQILGVQRNIDKISTGTEKWKTGLLGISGIMVGIGASILTLDYRLARAGDRIIQLRQRMRGLGATEGGVNLMEGAAFRASRAIPAVSFGDSMQMARNMYGLFMNASEAAAATQAATMGSAVLRMSGIQGGAEALADIIKSGEMSGAIYNRLPGGQAEFSVERTKEWIDAAVRGLQIPGGELITSSRFRQAMMRAQPATYMIEPENLIPLFVEGVQQMGSPFGRGLGMAYRPLTGAPVFRGQLAAMERAGLIHPGDIQRVKGSGSAWLKPGSFLGTDEFLHDPVGWMRDVFLPQMAKMGITSTTGMLSVLMSSFSQSGGRVLGDILMNLPAYERTRDVLRNMPSMQQQYQLYRQTVSGSMLELSGAIHTLEASIGRDQAGFFIEWLHSITDFVQGINPAQISSAVAVVTSLGVAIGGMGVILGGAAVLALLGPMGTLAALATGIVLFGETMIRAKKTQDELNLKKTDPGAVAIPQYHSGLMVFQGGEPGQAIVLPGIGPARLRIGSLGGQMIARELPGMANVLGSPRPVLWDAPLPLGLTRTFPGWHDTGTAIGYEPETIAPGVPFGWKGFQGMMHPKGQPFYSWDPATNTATRGTISDPLYVVVKNASEVGGAAVQHVADHLEQPHTSSPNFSTRVSPFPTPGMAVFGGT